MPHLYHHLNTAWNARYSSNAVGEASEDEFRQWGQFPSDSADVCLEPISQRGASTEGGEAPGRLGATTENTELYLREEQRRRAGCIAGRMPRPFVRWVLELLL